MAICVWLLCLEDSTLFAGRPDVIPSGSGPLQPAGSAAGHLVICLSPRLGPQPSSSPSNPTKCNTELESQRWAAWCSLLHCTSNGWEGTWGHSSKRAQGTKMKAFRDRKREERTENTEKSQEKGGGEFKDMWMDYKDHEILCFSWSTQSAENQKLG